MSFTKKIGRKAAGVVLLLSGLIVVVSTLVFSFLQGSGSPVENFVPTSETYNLNAWNVYHLEDENEQFPLRLVDNTRFLTVKIIAVEPTHCSDRGKCLIIKYFASDSMHQQMVRVYVSEPGRFVAYESLIARFEGGQLVLRANTNWTLQQDSEVVE